MSQLSVTSIAKLVVGDRGSSSPSLSTSVKGAVLVVGVGLTSSASLSTSGCADVYFPESYPCPCFGLVYLSFFPFAAFLQALAVDYV